MSDQLPAEKPAGSTAPVGAKAKRAKAEAVLVDAAADIAESLVSVAKGEKTARREQIDAMKTVLDRAGIIPPERQASSDTKDLSELSPSELQSLLLGVEEQLARHAKPVNAARLDDRRAQPSDMFG